MRKMNTNSIEAKVGWRVAKALRVTLNGLVEEVPEP